VLVATPPALYTARRVLPSASWITELSSALQHGKPTETLVGESEATPTCFQLTPSWLREMTTELQAPVQPPLEQLARSPTKGPYMDASSPPLGSFTTLPSISIANFCA
jgi:hypothetical protein